MLKINILGPGRPGPDRLSMNEKIDVCRGLFAFLVVGAHALELSWAMHLSVPGRLPWLLHRFLAYAVGTGLYWVMGFFVISGYCIHLSVQRLIDRGSFPLKTYLIARLSRILPLYYLALVFAGLVEWWIAVDRPSCWPNGLNGGVVLCQLLMIQNFTQTFGCFVASWSITNEFFYYVFYGLIAFAVVRRSRRPATLGMAICLVAGIAMQLIYRAGYKSGPVLATGLLFGLGINWFLGAMIAERSDSLARDRKVQAVARFWPAMVATSIALWCSQHVHLEYVYLSSGFAFSFMLVRFLGRDAEHPGRAEGGAEGRRRWVTLLGLASYPTYLFHAPILILVGWASLRWNLLADWRWFWLVSASIALSCGLVLAHVAEQPILNWRAGMLRRLKDSPAQARPGAVPATILGARQ
jgi:peptidoglycan/LPS O-acetylase OafA/YrhL